MVCLGDELCLPCGAAIKNRFLKSAMSENLATVDHAPTRELITLYETWAEGGSGLVITGNIMVDSKYLGEPRNVVIEDERNLPLLQKLAQACSLGNTHLWAQLNHPGKQSLKLLTKESLAPSAIPLGPGYDRFFAPPRELKESEIEEIIERFAMASAICKKAGFTGVQIHGAHGYLVNQFLSPVHNQRLDYWGGSLNNRMNFLTEMYLAIRAKVGNSFPIGIKLNSTDFMRGGFSEEDAIQVILRLSELGIDLIEISGGNYESPVFTGRIIKESSLKREAYFLEFAERTKKVTDVPIAVTGGFRTAKGMKQALAQGGTDMVGLARPLAVEPNIPNLILDGEDYLCPVRPIKTGINVIDRIALLEITWYEQQMERLSKGKRTKPNFHPLLSLLLTIHKSGWNVFQKRRAR
ncbi:NADH:flavin oxidoreductase/NADH oxidase family protein [Bacillus sp. DTU_2020_1000418_1_SI_GHA_SEK_038]|uniref:NADH:flavin oxidoreductase/NADH oxidase family protein n=1 Tax=Bacillus sp. DTU_2020_1000418_1_SI_GHA_SEK_038 TaxID=3077585 RepID=UPI0028EFE802|nr:NADH:flavin oxidoreductase/NADH oxidase family protein [Bacillus sp. DTU_2020_1000418_1_SI_GHA_SEK_038]WNS76529.1 NADH:flavin oxidoreductase/NADH oxidase family protein [Bacillus sp. DTU_2020_1000418_1_SI_GHA_SEK_038]